MLQRARASHARSCKAPQSSEMVTNPGLLSGGKSGHYQHSQKVREEGAERPEKEDGTVVVST